MYRWNNIDNSENVSLSYDEKWQKLTTKLVSELVQSLSYLMLHNILDRWKIKTEFYCTLQNIKV